MALTLIDAAFLAKLRALRLAMLHGVIAGPAAGQRRSGRTGPGLEFSDFRPYVQGDDLRRLDWHALARFDQPILRLFVQESAVPLTIYIDCSASMRFGQPDKFWHARRLAAALAFVALNRGDHVQVITLGAPKGTPTRAFSSSADAPLCFKLLEKLTAGGQPDIPTLLLREAAATNGEGASVIVSDLLWKILCAGRPENSADFWRRLRANGRRWAALHVLSPQELTPELTGDTTLVDAETGEKIRVRAGAAATENYQRRMRAFLNGTRQACLQRQITYVRADTSLPAEDILARDLRALAR